MHYLVGDRRPYTLTVQVDTRSKPRTVTCIPRFEVCGLRLQPRVLGSACCEVADEERGPRRGRASPPRLRCHGASAISRI
jgi:hypothetical protein